MSDVKHGTTELPERSVGLRIPKLKRRDGSDKAMLHCLNKCFANNSKLNRNR